MAKADIDQIFVREQRWMSEMEPELGIGIIDDVDSRFVTVNFPASDTRRQYAIESAPLIRVTFKVGDEIATASGQTYRVESVGESGGIIVYNAPGKKILESSLSPMLSFSTPRERLLNGQIDMPLEYQLRYRAHQVRYDIRKSEVLGYAGGRIDLIPHQIYVAHEVASRIVPRVLLADETGLGKTIEACLIMHRLLISGRISRVLIIVPHSLVHQWFVELLRKFNLFFRIFDEEYFNSIRSSDPEANPFHDDQLVLAGLDFLISDRDVMAQVEGAGWDLTIVDEAHHLTGGNASFDLVKNLSRVSHGLMLLTATPEQLGHRNHFLRLNLIDPDRYFDFDVFEQEEKRYGELSSVVENLMIDGGLCRENMIKLAELCPDLAEQYSLAEDRNEALNEAERTALIGDLIDRYGTGRSVFRNTRATVPDFPKREASLILLEGSEDDRAVQTREFNDDYVERERYKDDPRIIWLAELLSTLKNEKVLLICRSVDTVMAIEASLVRKIKVNVAVFHEGLSLIQRDRNAANFASQSGARILLCSEIGSEGRNFQFCHHMVLFDLPLNPELLEQRIGRLDRIGQHHTIKIYVPYISGSENERLAMWYADGLGAFEHNVAGAYRIYAELGAELHDAVRNLASADMKALIDKTSEVRKRTAEALKKGRDYLLEMNSNRPEIAEKLIEKIDNADRNRHLERFMLNMFDMYDIRSEEIARRTYRLDTTAMSTPEFPLPIFKQDALIVTFDRASASHNEDIEFISTDHPMVSGALDLYLSANKGNCTNVVWPGTGGQEVLLEAVFVAECIASPQLYVDRFLPPCPIRSIVNHKLEDCTEIYSGRLMKAKLKLNSDSTFINMPEFRTELLPQMIDTCKSNADRQMQEIIREAHNAMEQTYSAEVRRLSRLKDINENIAGADIERYEAQRVLLSDAFTKTRLRLDALRIISKT
jgi:ATP-dependent helicase HepA